MFFAKITLFVLAAVSTMASPTPPSSNADVKVWTGEEALAAGLLKVVPGPTSPSPRVGVPTPELFSDQILLWNKPFPDTTTRGYDPGSFGQGFFFCVDFTVRDTFFNDMAESFFVATDLDCNLYINAGCTGTAITSAPRGDFIALTGIFNTSITSLACEWQP
ncbi:hypothetical protein R3P38DRAFT_3479651 [Favolaschia claudopus]|uniref:Uncharacterized protein n=1 Tax=Favolaschia claudopus TaxID=2862362 RepID=A0AAV9ZAV5_9AGAR